MKKLIVIGIIILLVGMSIPSTGINVEKSTASYDGNIFYVGGSGPGNYTKIQDAINDSSKGDTVFVYNGTFNENVKINRRISLVGEDKNNTIIDGGKKECTIVLQWDRVNISGFTICNSGTKSENAGIDVYLGYRTNIFDNIIESNWAGIYLYCTEFCNIENNIISKNKYGILTAGFEMIGECWCNNISKNIISKNTKVGIYIGPQSFGEEISNNTLFLNRVGIKIDYIWSSYLGNIIQRNNITKNLYGLISYPTDVIITQNNFIKNIRHALCRSPFFENYKGTVFIDNYWGKPRNNPYLIPSRTGFIFDIIPWIPHFDMNPSEEPYDI